MAPLTPFSDFSLVGNDVVGFRVQCFVSRVSRFDFTGSLRWVCYERRGFMSTRWDDSQGICKDYRRGDVAGWHVTSYSMMIEKNG